MYETLYPIFDPPRLLDLLNPLEDWQQRRVRQAVLDRMGVAFLISDRKDVDARWPIAREATADGVRYWVYRNETAMPRAYVVPAVKLAPDDIRAVGLMPWISARDAVLMASDPLEGVLGPRQSVSAGGLSVGPSGSGRDHGENRGCGVSGDWRYVDVRMEGGS